MTIALKLQLQN